MFSLEFNKFNNNSGSFQKIIPNQAHFFLFEQKVSTLSAAQEAEVKEIKLFQECNLSFVQASSILSSVSIGGIDTVFVYYLDQEPCGRSTKYNFLFKIYSRLFKIFGLFNGTSLAGDVRQTHNYELSVKFK